MFRVSLELNEHERLLKSNDTTEKTRKSYFFLKFIDLLISAFIATPLTIIYWIATWDIFVIYIYKNDLLSSCAFTFLASNLILWLFYLFCDYIQDYHDSMLITGNWFDSFLKILLRFVYTYLVSLGKRLNFILF